MANKTKIAVLALVTCMGVVAANAALVAHYDFGDGDLTDDEQGSYDLAVNGTVGLDAGGFAIFTGAGYLFSAGIPETGTFTVSYWWRTSNLAGEGNYEGPSFSTESGNAFDWQFTKLGSNLQLTDTASMSTTPISGYADGTWYHTMIQSTGNTVSVWISAEGGSANLTGTFTGNQTDLVLEQFLFGVNRAKNAFGTFDLANVRIYDDATQSVATLLAEGTGIAEPSTNATIHSFGAAPAFFELGEPVTLSWSVSDADTVTIDQGIGLVASTGTVEVVPGATTTWTLTAERGTNSVIAHTTATLGLPTIQINFGITLDDANTVNADENTFDGLSGVAPVAGTGWNNALLRPSGGGTPTSFAAATQSGNQIDLIDSSGTNAGVNLTSTGALYSNFANVSSTNATGTGDGGLFNSALFLNNTESIQLSGLAAWATNGYYVRAFFDIGGYTRTYAITMDDGGGAQSFWTADTAATDSDPEDDGVMAWKETTGTTSASAATDANHALFGLFTGDTLTISGSSSGSRSVLSGIQIIPSDKPIATIISFSAFPSMVDYGETATLNWSVENADSVSIEGVGTVASTGSVEVAAEDRTTNINSWTLTASRGGTDVSAEVSVNVVFGQIDVYLLGGQSNMEGKARPSLLPAALLDIPEIVFYNSMYNAAAPNTLANLQPGTLFGPEIGFGNRLRDLRPGTPMALIKSAAGGTSLQLDWYPGTNATDTANWGLRFSNFVTAVNNGIAALEAIGYEPVIQGMCWQQGEQDAKDGMGDGVAESETSADDYGTNLVAFIARVREQFASHASTNGIRFVAGQVLPYAPSGGDVETRFTGRGLVRQAILDIDEDSGAALSVSNAAAIPVDDVNYPVHAQVIDGYSDNDEVHLGEAAQLNLGIAMAYAMLGLKPVSYAAWAFVHGIVGGPDDDDDGDGFSNSIEYALDGNPSNTPSALLTVVDDGGQHFPTYTVQRNLEASDTSLMIDFSLDLIDWTNNVPDFVSSTMQPDGTSVLIFRSPEPLDVSGHAYGFFRTRIKNPAYE